ncbi:MAG TPA: ATP-binding protein [Gemmatales bacterium]|nr:ATP-binding protein [Gemmatales bacterium]
MVHPDEQEPSQDPVQSILIFAIEPDEQKLVTETLCCHEDWSVRFVTSEKQAMQEVAREMPALFLIDMQDLVKHGIDLVDTLRRKHPLVPVVLLTRRDDEPVYQALRHGAVNYVPWKSAETELVEVVESVLLASEVRKCRNRLLSYIIEQHHHFTLGNDTSLIPALITLFQETLLGIGICDQAESVRVNMALEEALLNAIYHGNLEVSSKLRNDPERGDEPYRELIEQRRKLSPYRERKITVRAHITAQQAKFIITDQGPGFDPGSLPDPTDPEHIELASGRGLLLIRTFMDEISHNATGNEITMIKKRQSKNTPT